MATTGTTPPRVPVLLCLLLLERLAQAHRKTWQNL